MIGGFFAIPSRAARVCASREDILALYWCCREADVYGWGEEFQCSNTMLQEVGGGSRTWAQRFIAKMERVGSMVVVHPGHRHKTRVIAMVSPFKKPDHGGDHDGDHGGDHNADHQDNGTKPITGKSNPPPRPPTGPPVRPQPVQSIDQTTDAESKTRGQNQTTSIAMQDIWDHWRTLAKGHPKAPGIQATKMLGKWLKVADVESICIWLDYCIHGHPWYRQHDITKFAVFMRDKVREDGLVESRRWHDGGRTTPAAKPKHNGRGDPWDIFGDTLDQPVQLASQPLLIGGPS